MQIPDWMITEEMKHTEHYRMYVEVFGIDVPLTQSQPTESTQGMNRTPSALRSPNPNKEAAESSAPRRSTRDDYQRYIPVSLAEHKFMRTGIKRKCGTVDEQLWHLKKLKSWWIDKRMIWRGSCQDKSCPIQLADNLHDVMVETLPTMDQILTQNENAIDNVIPSQVDASVRSYMPGHILHVHPVQSQTSSVPDQQYQLHLAMKADSQLQQQDIAIWLALQMKFERNTVPQTACRRPSVRLRDQEDPHDDAHPEGENSAKRQRTSEYKAYVSRESSSGKVFQEEQAPSTSGNQEQDDDFDFWTDSYASDDDEIPTKQVSQDIMEEVSLTIDEAKLRKMADEMLRQRCTSGDEHQYHIDQMKNFLKSDIVWESRKEILVSPHLRKTTPLVHSCQKDLEAPALSLINQDLLYLKKGNYGPEKIVLSLHKFPAVLKNGRNSHAKDFYIRKQKEPGKPKEEVYSNSKIIQVVKTYWELGHEHKFITEIVARRANKYLVSVTEPDYKNDIEDIYLLIMNGKVPDYADTGLLWSLSVFIRNLTKDEAEYLKLFEEEIEERLKHRRQMRRWEMFVNGRPLGPRRERPK
ncbi:hypothetical protein Tco_1212902 [Tanacetum coccineum]